MFKVVKKKKYCLFEFPGLNKYSFDIWHVYGFTKKTRGGHDHQTLNNDHKKGLDHICQVLNIKNIQYFVVSYISSFFSERFDNGFDGIMTIFKACGHDLLDDNTVIFFLF